MYDFFSDFFDGFDIFPQKTMYQEAIKCPVCHRTYQDFVNSGRLGCGECYNTFRPQIAQTLREIHQNNVHTGKIPSKSGEELKIKRQYENLKKELTLAVNNEDYEKAAKLHKQIRQLESEAKKQ